MSKNTLILDNPIKINGKDVTEFQYDAQAITVDLFSAACAHAASATKSNIPTMKVKETDYTLHLYLGMAAIIAVNPGVDFSDLARIHGFDILDLTNIGTFFIIRKQAEPSEATNSDEQPESMPATSTQTSEGSGEND